MRNLQNDHIRDQLAKVSLAVGVLEKKNLTITTISIEGPAPLIEIIEGRGCQELRKATAKWITRNGIRECERVALVSQCQVRWLERN